MRVFYECVVIQAGPDIPITLISLGMVNEDGAELYLINGDVRPMDIYRRPSLREFVWPHLPLTHQIVGVSNMLEWDTEHPDYDKIRTREEIGLAVLDFVGRDAAYGMVDEEPVELWNYHGGFAHVALIQLFGENEGRPSILAQYSNTICQLANGQPGANVPYPADEISTALGMARWTKQCWEWCTRKRIDVGS